MGRSAARMTLAVDIRTRLSPQFLLDVAFTVPPGITILFGASGSGKTTVLRSVSGLSRPESGRLPSATAPCSTRAPASM